MTSSLDDLTLNKFLLEPELHVIGEVVGASEIDSDNAFCSYQVHTSHRTWTCVGGELKGQTQVDYPESGEMFVWNQPLDAHYFSKSVQGWPRIILEVGKLDDFGAQSLVGYGFTHIPMQSGEHDIEIPIWRPVGNPSQEVEEYYLNTAPYLLNTELIHNPTKAKEERCWLKTKSAGRVHLHLEIILRNLKQHDVKSEATLPSTSKLA
eukprot:TRINITY_DN6277_c0_g1_i1.p1 TRINITY_DN6277_c0_g1~~TRINITY_DN6277_c0_g1_i1.p1  ORF type:complete len:207 (+),score=23.36 TRINITY_DN6277_c0_g1_i1:99-719(+)